MFILALLTYINASNKRK
ncbi:hypothetical protein L0M14_12235 [Paenibacillus hexagrammi]|uniref:Uncharacterized protein n=1 Tax=Paenibacillus hexagrammi TaxID=2908839 RepID=A0ABY3ST50_9BACL|nr:hypothetical protein L0M14_12235 [Paenibacillus sp. YPD9-1]